MPEITCWLGGEGGMDTDGAPEECPEDSILLAYVNNQQFPGRVAVARHLAICPRCFEQCQRYEALNVPLRVLAQTRSDEVYPSVALSVMRRVKRYENRPKLPTFSVPFRDRYPVIARLAVVVVVLVILFVLFALTVAATQLLKETPGSLWWNKPFTAGTSLYPSSHATLTPTPDPISTEVSSPTVKGGPGLEPTLVNCSTSDDRAHQRLVFCGSHYTPGDKVSLVILETNGAGPKNRLPVTVGADGTFQVTLVISNCRVPVAVTVQDYTHPSESGSVVENLSVSGCSKIRPTPTPAGTN